MKLRVKVITLGVALMFALTCDNQASWGWGGGSWGSSGGSSGGSWGSSGGSWGSSGGSWGSSGGSWGSSGGGYATASWGSSGGSSGGSWGSSGGSWGSSGGGYATASWGSSGGSWGSSGGSSGGGFFSRMASRIHARHRRHSGSWGSGGSSGSYGVSAYSYGYGSGGSSGSYAVSSYGYGSGGSGGSTGSILSSGYAYDSGGSSGAYGATYSAPSYVQSYAVEVYSQPDCFEPVVTVDPVVDSLDCDDCVVEESTGIIDHGSTDQGVMIESDGNIEEPAVIDGVESVPADRDEGKAQHPEARMRNSGMLVLNVPDSATVFVNGYKTSSTGALRRMMSSGLEPGHSYSYEVRVVDGGQAVTKVASLTAGQTLNLSFDLQENADSRTVVTLDVPNDAKVKLAGSAMKQTGSHRVFATDRLSPGESWDDYVVQVTIERDGRTLTQQRKLNVRGGESYELTFDFEEGRLASL